MRHSQLFQAAFVGLLMLASTAQNHATPAKGPSPDAMRYARQLLPDIIELLQPIVRLTAAEKHAPHYVSLSAGRDEYVYHLRDKVFIRCEKNRFELPAWRTCGDYAIVRIELMDEDMKTSTPVMAWTMIYRQERWQHLLKNEDGTYTYENSGPISLPPYAARCFNTDRQERMLDR